ncbi:DNA polymerase III subunit epsilon [Mangrovactinospora gilvigrisea]|uniref:DNA polymerase III subunit epsilon n=1 Tax=Mangrovactinospora gilvigrisea TaxID=1428644 RepID=A0A1J7CBV1_9ACTN|nr:DEDDh family exonuclease [Mangrovactinospora gilvigrisea]OIV38984.1 DNA polymerase III subunit epsilon [Mangrovactinospora gilvigrisea]
MHTSITGQPPGAGARPEWPAHYPAGYAVVDVETTGLSRTDRIVSAAVYRLDGHGEVVDHWYSPVNPLRDPGPVWIHGLTSELLADAPTFPEVAEELTARLAGRVLVAHNARFDWTMLAREFARCGGEAAVEERLCTIVLSKELALPLRDHKLPTLAAHFGVRPRHAHHALDDARVLAEVFRPSLRMAADAGLELPLQRCRPMADPTPYENEAPASLPPSPTGPNGATAFRQWRPRRTRAACPYANPGAWQPESRLVQGMRIAFTGDTAIDREVLEDRAERAGLKVATSVSGRTSLLVTNDRADRTTKARRARELSTPVVDEPTFLKLLEDVAPGRPA